MGQITIYLDDETEKKMIENARLMKLSKSKWVAGVIREKLVDQWPDTVRDLAGSWDDFPSLDELRGEESTDAPRETL